MQQHQQQSRGSKVQRTMKTTVMVFCALIAQMGAAKGFMVAPSTSARSSGATSVASLSRTATIQSQQLHRSSRFPVLSAGGMTEAEALELKAKAAALRAEADLLQDAVRAEELQRIDASFREFDTNGDNEVDVVELRAGLERVLREELKRRLQFVMGRIPREEEVDERIKEMPSGTLLSEELAQRVLAMLDTNMDGKLQKDEFRKTSDVRARLEKVFNEDRLAQAEEKRKAMEEQSKSKAEMQYNEARRVGMPLPEDYNNGPPSPADRLFSVVPYILPLLDSVNFAEHIFRTYPDQMAWAQPLVTLFGIYRSIPLSGLALILAISFTANNPGVNKLVRFNLRQAVNLDVALFFTSFLISAGAIVGQGDVAASFSDVSFLTVAAASLYASLSSAVLGKEGALPFVKPRAPDLPSSNTDDEDDNNTNNSA